MIYKGLNRIGEIADVKAHGGADVAEVYGGINEANPIYYKTRTLTGTLPLSYKALGKPLSDYLISGNTVQNGTPAPDAPVDVQGVGVRTRNIYNTQETVWIEDTLDDDGNPTGSTTSHYTGNFTAVKPNTLYYISKIAESTTSGHRIYYYDSDKNWIGRSVALAYNDYSFTTPSGCKYIQIQIGSTLVNTDNWMISEGLSQVSFEPYGYKIPPTVNGTEYPIYLGQVPTTRRIKKLVLTGEEGWDQNTTPVGMRFFTQLINSVSADTSAKRSLCTHYPLTYAGGTVEAANVYTISVNGRIYISSNTITGVTAFKSWLKQQYTAGTPVTVWYVFATPTTGIVNEPLHKIGNYADTISMAQAGVTIPTVAGDNVLDMTSPVKPSSVSITGNIKPTGYGQLLDVNNVEIYDKNNIPVFITG